MSSNTHEKQLDNDNQPAKKPIEKGSTRFRNTEYAEQMERWHDDDDRR